MGVKMDNVNYDWLLRELKKELYEERIDKFPISFIDKLRIVIE